jgi:8-oxo-dGTP pyrophosphatase MutT (NUDIX family)
MEQPQRLIICILVVREALQGRELLLQRRCKPNDDTPYSGYLELPQGKVQAGETLVDAARRELFEETRLSLGSAIAGGETPLDTAGTSDLWVSHPLICVADRLQNHIGLGVVFSATGTASSTREADSLQWYSDREVAGALQEGRVFPLNGPMLLEYLNSSGLCAKTVD